MTARPMSFLSAINGASANQVTIVEHPGTIGANENVLELRYQLKDRTVIEALKKIAPHLPELIARGRDGSFETRALALLRAFALPDPLADKRLRIVHSDARAREEFFERIPVLTAAQVTELARRNDPGSNETAEQWEQSGRILSVPGEGSDLYPAFQFENSQPLPIIAEILNRFRADPGRTRWQNAFWFASANGWLGGPAPMSLISKNPDRVLVAVNSEMTKNDY